MPILEYLAVYRINCCSNRQLETIVVPKWRKSFICIEIFF